MKRLVDLSVEVAGIKFRNPVWTAAGPVSWCGEILRKAAENGAGGLVCKTISVKPADVPRPNMALVDRGWSPVYFNLAMDGRVIRVSTSYVRLIRGMLNAELWSELPAERWLEKEYSIAKATGLPVIASIGYTAEELRELGPKVQEAGVDAIEFSLHYLGIDYRPMIEIAKALRESVDIPIFAKVSPHIVNLQEFAAELERVGVNGIVAINSLGPCLSIDIETGKPLLGGKSGYGWLSGPAIKPLGVRCVADIARAVKIPVIGVGGIASGRDAMEYIMAGASAVQICTQGIIEGPKVYGRVASELKMLMEERGYESIEDFKGIALKYLPKEPIKMERSPVIDEDSCRACGLCAESCMYGAISPVGDPPRAYRIDENLCERCGLCMTVCPVKAVKPGEEIWRSS